jgi:peptidoglycan hydrolase-like protein with peptidoglycan-binding domain
MRLPPSSIGEDSSSWSRGISADKALENIAGQGRNAVPSLKAMEPADPLYTRLKGELKKTIDDIANNPDGDRPPIDYPGILRPGRTHPAIAVIRSRLGAETESGKDPAHYDEKLTEAVMQYQGKHGLKPDGLIGQRTFAAINQGRTDRLIKILATMETSSLDERIPNAGQVSGGQYSCYAFACGRGRKNGVRDAGYYRARRTPDAKFYRRSYGYPVQSVMARSGYDQNQGLFAGIAERPGGPRKKAHQFYRPYGRGEQSRNAAGNRLGQCHAARSEIYQHGAGAGER